jgi:LmbE family N-acetylglucosaminyl deacetylase
MRRSIVRGARWALGCVVAAVASRAAETPAGAAILQDLRSFGTVATLLHVAAHPDDENTTLITYFARGRGYRTAYLSLTRGDGGQNELGPEFDEKLGLARTQELLAARRLDGGRQFFTRAIDFGYSKSVDETLQFWDRKEVLGDVVRVIRQFRPDVVVTRFSPTAGGTHGHHTASAVLAVEAFKLAGDPKAYPEQLAQGLTVWQPRRVVLNGFGGRGGPGGGNAKGEAPAKSVRISTAGNDPVLGQSYAEIALRSRRMHVTQGFANIGMRGTGEETFLHLGGEPAEQDLFDGVDTTWARVAGGAEIGRRTAAAIAAFEGGNPAGSIPALLAIRAALADLAPGDPVVADKRAQLDRIVQACLGVTVETRAEAVEVVPGEALTIVPRVSGGDKAAVQLKEVRVHAADGGKLAAVAAGGAMTVPKITVAVPKNAPLTQPYWLREEGRSGIARVDDPTLIGTPENAPAFSVEYEFEVGGQALVVRDEPKHAQAAPKGERLRRVDIIPPIALGFAAEVSVFAPGKAREVVVEMLAARAGVSGRLKLDLPAGWSATPAERRFATKGVGERQRFAFVVQAPAGAASGRATAHAVVGDAHYTTQRIAIDYPHLPPLLLQPPARARLLSVDVAIRGRTVGYLPGAGDATAEALEQLGYAVKTLDGADLTTETLRPLDAVVVGVRAFNERKDLKARLPALFAYVEAGGTVIVQYNRPSGGLIEPLGPFPLSIAGPAPQLRVTDERAPVSFLAPEHAVLQAPNRIGPSDFEGWVQERGAYFPSTWDDRYTPVLAMSDAGEAPLRSSLLVARHGKGHYVYTGVAFFRQLPAGVPGAYRLFANLVSLGR